MVFNPEPYSVLVLSASMKFNDVISAMLPASDYYPVNVVCNVAAARRNILSRGYDFVIINAPLPDDMGIKFALDCISRSGTVVLFLIRADQYENVSSKLTPQGVYTLSKPLSNSTLQQAINWLCASRERLRKLESKARTVEDKMEEIRLVNRAKWLLIEKLGLSEQDAHRNIEKQAMDKCITKKEVALNIIADLAKGGNKV